MLLEIDLNQQVMRKRTGRQDTSTVNAKPLAPIHHKTSSNLDRARWLSDITCDAVIFPRPVPAPSWPAQKRRRSTASGRLSSLPTMLYGTDLSQRPRFSDW